MWHDTTWHKLKCFDLNGQKRYHISILDPGHDTGGSDRVKQQDDMWDWAEGNTSGHLSSPKLGHITCESGRHGAGRTARRGDAEQNKVPTFRSPWKPTAPLALQRTVKNCCGRPFTSTNNLSNQKSGHTTSGSGRGGARRSNGAAWGWIGRDALGSIR